MYVGRDDNKHGDAMNFDEAMSEAVQGARVTCDYIGEGVYVAYNFGGWRIHHGDMASSGFAWRDEHKAAEWRIVCAEHVWTEGAEGAFAGFTHHCVHCGIEGAPEVPKRCGGCGEIVTFDPILGTRCACADGRRKAWHEFGWAKKRIVLGEAGVPADLSLPKNEAKLNVCRCGSKIAAAYCCGTPAAKPANVGTAAPLSGLALARLERAKAAEPLPEPPKPVKPWGAPAAKPWGPGK